MKHWIILIALTFLFSACSNNDDGISVIPTPPDNNTGITEVFPMPCDNGLAGIYPCNGYDLLGRLSLTDLNAGSANDIWGWTDSASGREFAIIGLNNGTAFVEITDTDNLLYLGKLPSATISSAWRDIKVYQDYAFIVAEAADHGMQIFDLRNLLEVSSPPMNFTANDRYTGIGESHNIIINESTGFAYVVGSHDDIYNGGPHFINIQDPENVQAAGGYADSGYSHDGQVVTYTGPDADYAGREIFIGANENQMVIVDVTDKQNPANIAGFQYSNVGYTHQGWFTEDQRYFFLGDELDEINNGFNSKTLVVDLLDLDQPVLHTTYTGLTSAIDHNGYVKGSEFFLANYTAGVRVLDISGIDAGTLVESGFFDSYPSSDNASFNGVWSVYPYFESGKLILSDMNSGLFIIQRSN